MRNLEASVYIGEYYHKLGHSFPTTHVSFFFNKEERHHAMWITLRVPVFLHWLRKADDQVS